MLSRRLTCAIVVACLVVAAQAQDRKEDDERFLGDLETSTSAAVDRTRLARLIFGSAAQLTGGMSNVGILRAAVVPRDPSQRGVVDVAAARFEAYRAAVETFRASATSLLDEPGSASVLDRALRDGQHACWLLDRYSRLAETYGASSADMMTILSSTEACVTLRRAAFLPAVHEPVTRALAEHDRLADTADRLRREVELLEAEVAEMEALLRELADLDAGE